MLTMDSLSEAIARASLNRSRLVFLSDDQSSRAEFSSYDLLNLNKSLSEQLMNVPRQERAKSVGQMVDSLISGNSSNEVLIDGIEILFDRSLAVDPIRLLGTCAKNKTLLVCWPGDKTSSGLSYAVPSHPEHRTYKTSDLNDVIILNADAQLHWGM